MGRQFLLNRARAASTLVASACFVLGVLYASVEVHRLDPVWSPEQQLLLATATIATHTHAGSSGQQTDANSDKGSEEDPAAALSCWDRSPPVWPDSMVVTQKRVPDHDSKVGPATTITYYDHDRGGNLIQVFPEENSTAVLWDLELTTGHSYYFRPSQHSCKPVDFPVGILRKDWLRGAAPLGPSWSTWRKSSVASVVDANADATTDRLVCGWTKADFIDYYEDAITGEPDSWYFHNMKAHFLVLNYTAPATIDPSLFVPPEYCFS